MATAQTTTIRLTESDLARAEAVREAMEQQSGIAVTRHQILLSALRKGLEVLEKQAGPARKPRRP